MPANAADRPLDEYSSRVLDVVDEIPPGRVMSYGDIADYLNCGGPRQVGRVMAAFGGGVAWWRVIRADGTPPPGHESRALAHYLAEGTPLRSARPPVRVDMRRARWPGLTPPASSWKKLVEYEPKIDSRTVPLTRVGQAGPTGQDAPGWAKTLPGGPRRVGSAAAPQR